MYAVIRSGGKQYRVSPGDVVKLEKVSHQDGNVEISDVLAVRGDNGFESLEGALVRATVVEEDRDKKILVFHLKRKKQYKKLAGHRQPYTRVRITGIRAGNKEYGS